MLAQIEQDVAEAVDLLNRVVVNQRSSHGAGFDAQSEALHKPGRIQVAISYADVRARHRFRNLRWSNTREIETEGGDAFPTLSFVLMPYTVAPPSFSTRNI